MRGFLTYGLLILLGLAAGIGLAVMQVKGGLSGGGIANGPWRSAENVGTAKAGLQTRAVVAVNGLLALPDSEATYFNAKVDSNGDALDGSCHYLVKGGAIPARWWSMTAYGQDGYLMANRTGYYSVSSAMLDAASQNDWAISVGPDNMVTPENMWIPTLAGEAFELTLRAYHPEAKLLAGRATVPLPSIEKQGCPS
ncbi:MAG: DUF1214 domain-containing protein [Blastomonas sp.]